jgi:hypothetical protein
LPQEIAPEAAPPEEVVSEVAMPGLPAAEVPDWLQEIAPEAAPPEEAAPEVAMPGPPVAEAPDWLQEIALEAVPPEDEAVPEAAMPGPPAVEIPDWLFELGPAPPSAPAAPAFPLEPGAETAVVGELARAEIPAWMEELRPRALEPEAAVEEEPPETEGVLKGLRGVLAPALAIEVPTVREDAVSSEIREASLARAQLLQSLLAQPTETPQPEIHKRGPRVAERVQRWLVTVVLAVVIIVVALAALEEPVFTVPTLTQPVEFPETSKRMDLQRLTGMYETVESLSVSAGDTVLVAFEYGPAEADELKLVAGPVLRHLLDQGAHISVASTRPEAEAVGV